MQPDSAEKTKQIQDKMDRDTANLMAVMSLIGNILVLPLLCDHILRTYRGRNYDADTVDLKITMLNEMNDDDRVAFVSRIHQLRQGNSNTFASTRTSKKFDGEYVFNNYRPNFEPKDPKNFEHLINYMKPESGYIFSSRHNVGRTFFGTVMSTRNWPEMLKRFKSIADDRKIQVINAIVAKYEKTPDWRQRSSKSSRDLYEKLKLAESDTQKIELLTDFLKTHMRTISIDGGFQRDDKGSKMLTIIEAEMSREFLKALQEQQQQGSALRA